MLRVYEDQLVGQAPRFPREIEDGIDQYLAMQAVPERGPRRGRVPGRDPGAPLVGTVGASPLSGIRIPARMTPASGYARRGGSKSPLARLPRGSSG